MKNLARYRSDPTAFIDQFIPKNEKGRPWTLSAYQRRVLRVAFRFGIDGRLPLRLLLWSEPKKSGKTFLAACLGIWWAFTRPQTEVIVAANDLEQSLGRVFKTMTALCRVNPQLATSTTLRASDIFVSNGTVITAIASEYRGAAGARHSLAVFDELWGYGSENAQRLYEELTPPPTEPSAWVLVVTYAGFAGESKLLETLYQRGLGGQHLDEGLEVYGAEELVMFWSHTPRQPWQTPAYYDQQRRTLRPSTYLRLHENRWVSAESTFITSELWDACVDPDLRPVLSDPDRSVYVGVDAATKHDTAAVVAVSWADETRVDLVAHRIWHPTPQDPLDLEATVETYLRELRSRMRLGRVLADPFQLHRSITTLKAAGLPIEEFPQTTGNTTLMGQTLFDLLKGRNLRVYPADDVRAQALNTVAVESARGWRIAKEKASRKIDVIVALAMACVGAVQVGAGRAFKPRWSARHLAVFARAMADLRGPSPALPPTEGDEEWRNYLASLGDAGKSY